MTQIQRNLEKVAAKSISQNGGWAADSQQFL